MDCLKNKRRGQQFLVVVCHWAPMTRRLTCMDHHGSTMDCFLMHGFAQSFLITTGSDQYMSCLALLGRKFSRQDRRKRHDGLIFFERGLQKHAMQWVSSGNGSKIGVYLHWQWVNSVHHLLGSAAPRNHWTPRGFPAVDDILAIVETWV